MNSDKTVQLIAIHANKQSDEVISFANKGMGMSDAWWKKTHKINNNGELWGVYKVPSGLRRNMI